MKLIRVIKQNRKMIVKLAVNDFKAKYANSFLGATWAFVQPIITILVFWVVFQLGFKSAPIQDTPFVLWLIPAYISWIFFCDILSNTSNCMIEYSYLVQKVKFDVEILPLVKIVSAVFVHLFFIGFIYVVFLINGYEITISSIQCVYYSFGIISLSFGLSMLNSAITVFFKDFSQIINVIIQIGFWATPIYWDPSIMDKKVALILKINPMYYIVTGYRSAFIAREWFWQRPWQSLYFWTVTVIIACVGYKVFSRLRPHFADEL